MEPPSAAPPWEAQMLCWLAFGDHEAFKRDMKRVGILIPAQGIPTSTARIFLRRAVQSPSAALLWEAQMLCWLALGEHEALKRDLKRVGILIPA